MRIVQLQEDDFDEHGRVILANIPKTIASAQNSQIPEETSGLNSSPIYTERSFVQTIIEAVTARKLVPRHQQTNRPLPAVDSAFGVVEFAEIQAWGLTENWCFKNCMDKDAANPGDATKPTGSPVGAGATITEPARRLSRLREEFGGDAKYKNGSWSFRGSTKLAQREKSEGLARCDEKTVRADLKEAAQSEHDAKTAGFGVGLGSR